MGAKLWRFDEALRSHHDVAVLVGVDEAGRGPLAGPVVAAAVVLPSAELPALRGVRDSKSLTPRQREELFPVIGRLSVQRAVGWALSDEIDRHNILQASLLAMRRAIARLRLEGAPHLVVVDGNREIPSLPHRQKPLVEADAYSQSVAAASILAKVVRDRWMDRFNGRFPGYGFGRHKGYATPEHLAALDRLGPSPIHRRTFAPVAQGALFRARP
ncbi:MAG: ribonuclease HII [Elusimicrobia bacterium]|nr:ribonuclease HII [Elusimicrobiota bacterium]